MDGAPYHLQLCAAITAGSTLVCFKPSATPRPKRSIFCLRGCCQSCKCRLHSGYISGQRYNLSMKTHVSRTVSSCFAALRQIHSIRRSVKAASFTLSLSLSLSLSRHLDGTVFYIVRTPQFSTVQYSRRGLTKLCYKGNMVSVVLFYRATLCISAVPAVGRT